MNGSALKIPLMIQLETFVSKWKKKQKLITVSLKGHTLEFAVKCRQKLVSKTVIISQLQTDLSTE